MGRGGPDLLERGGDGLEDGLAGVDDLCGIGDLGGRLVAGQEVCIRGLCLWGGDYGVSRVLWLRSVTRRVHYVSW